MHLNNSEEQLKEWSCKKMLYTTTKIFIEGGCLSVSKEAALLR
jgi:hypothetical protein